MATVPGDRGRFVRAFRPASDLDAGTWPATVPAARQLLRDGLELPGGVTILVGENGSGKSTVVEMMAEAYGRMYLRYLLSNGDLLLLDDFDT